jgi:hypothetical protein
MIKNEKNNNHLLPKCIGFCVRLDWEILEIVCGWLTISSNAKLLSKLLPKTPRWIQNRLHGLTFSLLLPLSNCYVRYIICNVLYKARKVYIDEVYSSSCHNVHIIFDAHKQEQILWSQNRSLMSWITLLLFIFLTIFDTTFSFVNSSCFVRIDDNI